MVGSSRPTADPGVERRRLRRRALGRAWSAGVLVLADAGFVALSSIGWLNTDLADVVSLTVFGASAALGIPVAGLLIAVNASAAGALKTGARVGGQGTGAQGTGRPLAPVSRRASLVLLLAFLRLPLLIGAFLLIAAGTDPTADGRWEIDVAFVGFAVVDILFMLVLAFTTKADTPRG